MSIQHTGDHIISIQFDGELVYERRNGEVTVSQDVDGLPSHLQIFWNSSLIYSLKGKVVELNLLSELVNGQNGQEDISDIPIISQVATISEAIS